MPDAPQPNSPEARTETGELKDQSQNQPNPDTTISETKPETVSTEIKPETKVETKPETKTSAPEKYEFKAPDGITFDDKVIAEASTLFKKLGLTNDQAQELVDFQAAQAKTQAEAPYTAYDKMREGWQNEVKADKEIGGILAKVKETISRALDTIGSPELVAEFKSAMNLTGAGDHPAFVKAFYKLASSIVEGKHVAGTNPSPHGQTSTGTNERPTAAQAMYPNLKS